MADTVPAAFKPLRTEPQLIRSLDFLLADAWICVTEHLDPKRQLLRNAVTRLSEETDPLGV
jgi:hypothetical protein